VFYGIKIATRYLTANRAQSLLLVLGVAVVAGMVWRLLRQAGASST